jgi:hypothetical protein
VYRCTNASNDKGDAVSEHTSVDVSTDWGDDACYHSCSNKDNIESGHRNCFAGMTTQHQHRIILAAKLSVNFFDVYYLKFSCSSNHTCVPKQIGTHAHPPTIATVIVNGLLLPLPLLVPLPVIQWIA